MELRRRPIHHASGGEMRTQRQVHHCPAMQLRRVVGSYSAGRIINPRTAKAQMVGGIVWGWGMAAMEQSRLV